MKIKFWKSHLGTCGYFLKSPAIFLAFVLFANFAFAETGLGRHKKAYAVPAPGKVVIDGKLDDWDLSGQILMFVASETADMQSAKFAMMYDSEALYLSAIIRDPTPMMNRHDPAVDGDKGWDADACQFRITLDPSMGYPIEIGYGNGDMENTAVVHLTMWYYTDKQMPCLQMHSSMKYKVPRPEWGNFGVVPQDLFEAKYLKSDDGKGFTFEYRIPWKTLGAKAPLKGGDLAAGTVQFCWSNQDGLKTAGGSAWCYDVLAGPGFPYQNTSCWGKIIFSAKGSLPKDIVEEGVKPDKPLPLKFTYDLPEDSQISIQLFDKDNYVRRILVAQGDRKAGQNTELWDGCDDVGKPLPAGDYAWKGVFHKPITTKFLFAAHNSGQPPYATDDGKGGWGGDHGVPTTACVIPDGVLLAWNVCENGWGILRCDINGKRQWGSKHCATYLATDGKRFFTAGDLGFDKAAGAKVFDLADGRPLNFGNGNPQIAAPAGGDDKTNEVTGLACSDGILYVSYKARNLIGLFDAASGDAKDTISVPSPGRMAVCPDKSLAVVSGGKILKVNGKAVATFAEQNLDQPAGIAADAEGKVFVSNCGKLQNISVFDKDGKYLRSIGKSGGRPAVGKYEKDGILEPGGITVDSKGQLWVAETLDSPKRFSVWNAADGSLKNEFFGAAGYFGWGWMDPRKPDELYCHNTIWKIDWAKNTCYPYSTIWRATKPNMIRATTPDGYAGHLRVMTAKNGKQFAWGMSDYSNMLYMREGDVFKPVAGTIRVAFGQYGSGLPYPVMKDIYEKTKAGAFLWQDANNDQEVQPEELVVSPAGRGETVFNWIDEDLNAWCDAGWIYKPASFAADGRPVYDFTKKTDIPFKGGNANGTSLWLDDKDDTVYTLNPGQKPGLARWTRDGKLLWGFSEIISWPDALGLPLVTPGKLHGLTMPLCTAGNFTGAVTYFNPYHIFTKDGVYVAMLTRDGRDGKGMGPDLIATEAMQGQIVKPDGMDRYFLIAGAHEVRVMEIFGLDTVKNLPGGTYKHSDDDVKVAMTALSEYAAKVAKSRKLSIARTRKSLDTAEAVGKAIDNTRNFTARAACDENNLYVSYEVNSPSELVNAIADQKMIFKGGNCLDIQLATDPSADPKRKTSAPGDVRLLVSRQADKTVAVIFRPKIKDFKGEPIILTSPANKESFDAIELTDKVALDYKKTPSGYKAVVTVPLALIGLAPKSGMTFPMDLGIIYGNATGSQTSARSYWVNNGFSANVTNDVPNESKLEPAEWGEAVIE